MKQFILILFGFKFFCSEFIEGRLQEDISRIKSKEINETENFMSQLVLDLNPAFKELQINRFEELETIIIEKFKNFSENYEFTEKFRNMLIKVLNQQFQDNDKKVIDNYSKNKIIDSFISYGVLGEKDKINLRYYVSINEGEIITLFEEGKISEEELYKIGKQKDIKKVIIELDKTKRPKKNKIQNYMAFLPKHEKIQLAINGDIPYDYLQYAGISKKDLFVCIPAEDLAKIINENKLPRSLKITSQDILDYYGRNDENGQTIISGTSLYSFIYSDCVNSKDVINIIDINNILRMSEEKDLFDNEEVLIYYSDEKIANMFWAGNIDSTFITKYKKALGENFENKSNNVLQYIKNKIMQNSEIAEEEKENMCQQTFMALYECGICTPSVLKQNISSEYIEKSYFEEKISDDDILNLYKDGVIDGEIIMQYFSDAEIFDLYLQQKLPYYVIKLANNREEMINKVLNATADEKMQIGDTLKLYFEDIISVEQIGDLREIAGDIEFLNYINKDTSFEKIKELFQNYLIDYSLVTTLKNNSIITESQFEELSQIINKEEFMDSLHGTRFILFTNRERKEKIENEKINVRDKKSHYDFDSERVLISTIFPDIDVDNLDNCATIESYNAEGNRTSLYGYKVLGSKETGLVIFAKFKKENATFIMPFEQAAYFLQSSGNTSNEVKTEDRMKDKNYLKKFNQVRVIMHTKHFAKNFKDACIELCPEINERMNLDQSYKKSVEGLIEEIREEYMSNKDLSD